jgi:hypothetical protein
MTVLVQLTIKKEIMTILQILNQIEATRSKKEKVAIMTQHKDNQDLRQFFTLCLHPRINFFQKKDMGIVSEEAVPTYSLAQAMEYLEKTISARIVTGNDAIEGIRDVLAQVSADDAEIIRRILKKKTGCGVDSSVNDVWPKLIPEHPNLLASPYSDKLAAALNWKKGVIVECLSADWQIQTEFDGIKTIGEIVKEKYSGRVLSKDIETGVDRYEQIVNHFDNGITNDDWYVLDYEENGEVKQTPPLTGNHKIWFNGSWICVKDIEISDS